MTDSPPATLKETLFNARRFRHVAEEVAAVYPDFDFNRFLTLTLPQIPELSLMARLDLMSTALHSTLPGDFRAAVGILRKLAPRINAGFVTLALPRFVALYGTDDFEFSLDALKFFTRFGSSEFAVREFIRLDPARTLAVMREWADDADEHVRRLACEGCRPRLPWSFRLEMLVDDPEPVFPILEALMDDPSVYVRKSVANHLNDITKNHPERVLRFLSGRSLENPRTARIVKQALRTLIKKGDARALALIGAGEAPRLAVTRFIVAPATVRIGDDVRIAVEMNSTAPAAWRLVVDCAVHYVKQSGATSEKVFKWKEFLFAPGASVSLDRKLRIRNFTTRVHHAGTHKVELVVNGARVASGLFELLTEAAPKKARAEPSRGRTR